MKKSHFYFVIILSLIIISTLAFLNLRLSRSIPSLGIDKIDLIKPDLNLHLNLACFGLKKDVNRKCCDMKGRSPNPEDDYEYSTREMTFTCPAPHEDTSYTLECLDREFEDEEVGSARSRARISFDKSCRSARKKYEQECQDLPQDFCPERDPEAVSNSGVALPLCSDLYEYWYGAGQKDPVACNPLGTPTASSLPPVDIIPTSGGGSSVPPFSSNPDGSDSSTTSETDEGTPVNIDFPQDINEMADIFRLEVPGNRLRYTFMVPAIRYALSLARAQDGVDCNINNLSCAVNPLLVKSDPSDSYGAFLTYALGVPNQTY